MKSTLFCDIAKCLPTTVECHCYTLVVVEAVTMPIQNTYTLYKGKAKKPQQKQV